MGLGAPCKPSALDRGYSWLMREGFELRAPFLEQKPARAGELKHRKLIASRGQAGFALPVLAKSRRQVDSAKANQVATGRQGPWQSVGYGRPRHRKPVRSASLEQPFDPDIKARKIGPPNKPIPCNMGNRDNIRAFGILGLKLMKHRAGMNGPGHTHGNCRQHPPSHQTKPVPRRPSRRTSLAGKHHQTPIVPKARPRYPLPASPACPSAHSGARLCHRGRSGTW